MIRYNDLVTATLASAMSPVSNTKPDLEYCHDTVQEVSRTFALTIDALGEPLADEICVGYLLCRIPDTIEDASHIPVTTKSELLQTFRDSLDTMSPTTSNGFVDAIQPWIPPGTDSVEWNLVRNAPTVIRTFEAFGAKTKTAMRPPIQELTTGMIRFVERYAAENGIRIQSDIELRSYTHYVAGTVGTMITNLLTRDPLSEEQHHTLETTKEAFGRLLQLVNISKDVYEDYTTENNIYLPAEWLAQEGVAQAELLSERNRTGVTRVIERVLARAETHLSPAREFIQAMPITSGNTVAAWAIPYLLAVGTLRELQANPTNALEADAVKVPRSEVYAIAAAINKTGRANLERLQRIVADQRLDEFEGPITHV